MDPASRENKAEEPAGWEKFVGLLHIEESKTAAQPSGRTSSFYSFRNILVREFFYI